MAGSISVPEHKLNRTLERVDPVAWALIKKEVARDHDSLNLGAAENYPTPAVAEAAEAPIPGAEGYPGNRYHAGKQNIDEIERLCWRRALETFKLDESQWAVNVQALSGSLANVFCYIALMQPGDVLLSLELSHGGHLSHGFQTPTRKVSEVAIRFKCIPYHVDVNSGLIDYEEMEELASRHKPRIITVGGSAYSRLVDFRRVRDIADGIGALMHCDMAHFCGLVAAEVIPSPFPFCDLVTTTTSKTFRGPDAAIIFCKKWMKDTINQTVFPRFQAGTDHANIVALAVALLQAQTPESRAQQRAIVEGAQILAESLLDRGYRLAGGGTDTHLVLLDLRPVLLPANRAEKILELVNIYCNRNMLADDRPGASSGIRFGTAPMVSRGMAGPVFATVASFVHRAIGIAKQLSDAAIQAASLRRAEKPNSFMEFISYVGDGTDYPAILELRQEVCMLARSFPPPTSICE